MLKPLTLSLSLAVALGLCSVSKAGLHDNNCATCGLASPQGVVASPQSTAGCGTPACGPKHHFNLKWPFHHQVTYEWVLKKKHSFFNHGCSTCGTAPVYATGQAAPSGQAAAPTAQTVYGTGHPTFIPARSTTSIASAPAEMTPTPVGAEEAPPAPEVKATGTQGGLLLPNPAGGN
jgi:hypothetical protein